jgi:hypothetical protein
MLISHFGSMKQNKKYIQQTFTTKIYEKGVEQQTPYKYLRFLCASVFHKIINLFFLSLSQALLKVSLVLCVRAFYPFAR